MTYARARVFTGMISIGWWVVVCAAALAFDVPGEIAAFENSRPAATLGLFILGYVLLGFPLDLFGGLLLPKMYNRNNESPLQWFAKWCRGILIHGALLWSFGMVVILAANWLGTLGAIATVGLLMILQARFQLSLGKLVSAMHSEQASIVGNGQVAGLDNMRFLVVDSDDEDFTGGVVGRPGKETIVLPARWKRNLSPELMEIIAARRLGAVLTGSRSRGLLVAIFWNLVSFGLAAYVSPHALSTAAGIVDVALIFSLFSFVGLFGVLPFFSRKGILEVDAWARENGLCPVRLQRTFSFHNSQEGDSPIRPRFIEFFCHPIPSVENRMQNLLLEESPRGAWHVARQALYLSWSGMGLLSRFAHCNLGRPELWVMLPCE